MKPCDGVENNVKVDRWEQGPMPDPIPTLHTTWDSRIHLRPLERLDFGVLFPR